MSSAARAGHHGFNPRRLRLARRLKGLRQGEVADAVEVPSENIAAYEAGAGVPAGQVVERLAVTLSCSPDFFFRALGEEESRQPFFRSLRATPRVERDKASAYAQALAEVVSLLEEFVELPTVSFPRLDIAPDDGRQKIEDAAVAVRDAWQVPTGPVSNVVRILESKGAVVAALGAFDVRMDAFSVWGESRPLIILCSAKGDAARRRFDAAHELAHLVMHSQDDVGDRRLERQAHAFAAAFLMPAAEIEPFLPRRGQDLESLARASLTWGVSMQALLFRARDLRVLTEAQYIRAMKLISARGWRTEEPVSLGPPESPVLLQECVATLGAAGSSLDDVAEGFGVPLGRLERMLSVPETEAEGAQVVHLPAPATPLSLDAVNR